MPRIPKQKATKKSLVKKPNIQTVEDNKIVFSFKSLEKNEYFNLDSTCENWSNELFEIMKTVSSFSTNDIYSGRYSGRNTTLRIHQHEGATPPCNLPNSVSLDDMWQIRISQAKGGIHGIFSDNIFYVIWFDPQHNLYPSPVHGGLKIITPPSTCCKERDLEIIDLKSELKKAKDEAKAWEELAIEAQNKLICK